MPASPATATATRAPDCHDAELVFTVRVGRAPPCSANDAGRYQELVPRMGLHVGGTQCMPLSAANVQTRCSGSTPVPYSIVLIMACAPIHHRRTVEVDCM